MSITRYTRHHRQQPTWADALSGIDPTLRAPVTTAPTDWPLPAAAWRRDLRKRLMEQLKRTRWVTYTATPRSLPIGHEGHAWLTTEAPPADDQPRRRHRRRGSRGQGITTDRVVPNACPGVRWPPRRQRGDQWTLPAAESTPPGDDVEHRLARPNGAADRGLRADEISTQIAVQQIEQRFHLRWRFRWPQVRLARPDDGVRVPVDDPQGPPVADAFVAVPLDLGADLIEAAEFRPTTAGWFRRPGSAVAGFDQLPGGEGFQRRVHRAAGQPGRPGQVEAALRPATGLFQGLVDERGAVPQFSRNTGPSTCSFPAVLCRWSRVSGTVWSRFLAHSGRCISLPSIP